MKCWKLTLKKSTSHRLSTSRLLCQLNHMSKISAAICNHIHLNKLTELHINMSTFLDCWRYAKAAEAGSVPHIYDCWRLWDQSHFIQTAFSEKCGSENSMASVGWRPLLFSLDSTQKYIYLYIWFFCRSLSKTIPSVLNLLTIRNFSFLCRKCAHL